MSRIKSLIQQTFAFTKQTSNELTKCTQEFNRTTPSIILTALAGIGINSGYTQKTEHSPNDNPQNIREATPNNTALHMSQLISVLGMTTSLGILASTPKATRLQILPSITAFALIHIIGGSAMGATFSAGQTIGKTLATPAPHHTSRLQPILPSFKSIG